MTNLMEYIRLPLVAGVIVAIVAGMIGDLALSAGKVFLVSTALAVGVTTLGAVVLYGVRKTKKRSDQKIGEMLPDEPVTITETVTIYTDKIEFMDGSTDTVEYYRDDLPGKGIMRYYDVDHLNVSPKTGPTPDGIEWETKVIDDVSVDIPLDNVKKITYCGGEEKQISGVWEPSDGLG